MIRRDGAIVEVAAPALVPGDVVALAEGDRVPADCRLIEAFDVKVDNATIDWAVWAVAAPFGFALIALDRIWKRRFR